MNAKRVRAAEGVIFAAQKTKLTAAGIAASLEAACMLRSPETAAELVALRARVTELERAYTFDTAALKRRVAEAVAAVALLEQKRVGLERIANAERDRVTELEAAAEAVRGQHYKVDGTFDEAGSCIQCGSNYPCATVQALSTEAPTRQADAPLTINQARAIEQDRPATAFTHDCGIPLTRRLDCGHCPHEICEDCDRCPHTCRCASPEDPHDSPLHHTYAVPRDLPEVTA